METSQNKLNEQFYNKLIENLYRTEDGDVYRASGIQEALKLANDKKYGLEYRVVEKHEMAGDQAEKLIQIIGLLRVISNTEDGSDLQNEIYHSSGDHAFTLERVQEELLNKMNAIDASIKLLKEVRNNWRNDFIATELFIKEMKEKKDSKAA